MTSGDERSWSEVAADNMWDDGVAAAAPAPRQLKARIQHLVDAAAAAPAAGGGDEEATTDVEPRGIAPLDEALEQAVALERAAISRKRRERRDTADDEAEAAADAEEERILASLRRGRDPFPIKCFLCAYGDPRGFDAVGPRAAPAFKDLVNMVKDMRASTDKRELARSMANLYGRQLWYPARGTDHELPVQTDLDFLEHIRRHTHNPTMKLLELQDQVFDALELLRLTYDSKPLAAADRLSRLGALAVRLVTIPRNKTYLGQHLDPLELDPAALGEVANMVAVRPLLRRAAAEGEKGGDVEASDDDDRRFDGARHLDDPEEPQLPM
jgi:hypothetical protein